VPLYDSPVIEGNPVRLRALRADDLGHHATCRMSRVELDT
jgi:hypothetical protein